VLSSTDVRSAQQRLETKFCCLNSEVDTVSVSLPIIIDTTSDPLCSTAGTSHSVEHWLQECSALRLQIRRTAKAATLNQPTPGEVILFVSEDSCLVSSVTFTFVCSNRIEFYFSVPDRYTVQKRQR